MPESGWRGVTRWRPKGLLTTVLLAAMIVAGGSVGGCKKKAVDPPPPPPPLPVPAPADLDTNPVGTGAGRGPTGTVPSPPPVSEPVDVEAEAAEQAYVEGDYERAALSYAQLIERGRGDDLALWRMALLLALPDTEVRDLDRSRLYLERLETTYPESPYQSEAILLALLLDQVQQLEATRNQQSREITRLAGELEKLKKIDLNRRKPPI